MPSAWVTDILYLMLGLGIIGFGGILFWARFFGNNL